MCILYKYFMYYICIIWILFMYYINKRKKERKKKNITH